MKPFVSIIIPALNEENYIENCLKSVMGQDYKGKYEIIVSDGMSKDDTVKIAKKYTHKIIVQKSNLAEARNLGANLANGEVLFFVDADTILPPSTISKVVSEMSKENAVGATSPILPSSSNFIDIMLYMMYNQYVRISLKPNFFRPHLTGLFNVYKKKVFERIGGFNETPGILEDLDMSERVSKFGKLIFVKDAMVITSNRRVAEWGKFNSLYNYIKIYFRHLLTGEAIPKGEYEPIR